jgi:hypothetical protein
MNRRSMRKATTRNIVFRLGLGLTIILCAGCIVPSQQAVRTGGAPQENIAPPVSSPSAQPQGLIKPTIPRERRQPDHDAQPLPPAEPEAGVQPVPAEQMEPQMPAQSAKRPQEEAEPVPPVVTPQPLGPTPPTRPGGPVGAQPPQAPKLVPEIGGNQPREKREWGEDQKIKSAALELAKSFPQVTRIKVCYAVKDDEWWVTLYDKAGPFTELKQYTWNRDQEKLEVFLVVKRIPSNRVEQQLNEEEPGKACEPLTVPSQPGKQ